MYKIINPPKVRLVFEGKGVSSLFSKKKTLPILINVIVDNKDLKDVAAIDGFNILDIQIVSEKIKSILNRNINESEVDFIPVKLIHNGAFINQKYYALDIKKYINIGCLSATNADWMPDAQYPVKNIEVDNLIFLDKELKFPIFSEKMVREINSKNLNITFFKYPSCC